MGASAREITQPSRPARRRRPRPRVAVGAGLLPMSAVPAEAHDLVDDLRALIHAGLIEPTTDDAGAVRYRVAGEADPATEEGEA
jgi:hypothetical protein